MDMNLQPLGSIQPFIDLGIYTVPLNSDIKRDASGKKIFKSPKNWQIFTKTFNEVATPTGALTTGPTAIIGHPGIIAIDCDSPIAYTMIKSLDPSYNAIAESEPAKGGTFFYIDDTPYPTINRGPLDIELFNGGSARMVFLPTAANYSKKHWYIDKDNNMYNHNKARIEFKSMPPSIRQFLDQWMEINSTLKSAPKSKADSSTHAISTNANNQPLWAPLVQEVVKTEVFHQLFFRIFTPKDFRMHQDYQDHRTLHPNKIPDGSGNEYLIKIANILVHDKSISKELFAKAIYYINNLWDTPWDSKRIDQLIAHQTGRDEWVYNEDWERYLFLYTTKTLEQVELFYAQNEDVTYEINYASGAILQYPEPGKVKNRLKQSFGFDAKQAESIILRLQAFNTVVAPHEPFGKQDNYKFNIFVQTPALEVLNNPSDYSEYYTEPTVFIQYMESFIPHKEDRDFFLRFWRTKFTTFSYSAIAFLIIGKPGSGKGTWSRIMEQFIGAPYIEKEAGKSHGLGDYTKWLKDKYITVFEELFKKLNAHEARTIIEQIKTWSGSTTFAVREMKKDHYTYPQHATFIINQNEENYNFDYDDRRFVIIDTPNKLPPSIAQEITKQLPTEKFQKDLAYYLATNYENLSDADYVDAPMSDKKMDRIFDNMPLAMKLFTYIKEEEYNRLLKFLMTYATNDSIIRLFKHRARNFMDVPDIVDIYLEHPDCRMSYEEALVYFNKQLQESKVAYKRTTKDVHGKKMSIFRLELNTLAYAPIKDTLQSLEVPSLSDSVDDGLDLEPKL